MLKKPTGSLTLDRSDARLKALLDQIDSAFHELLGTSLTGLYVHGSIAFGEFTWEHSDVDFIAVVEEPLLPTQKLNLLTTLIELQEISPPKGLEMSVLLRQDCQNFIHPSPFQLHYSRAWRSAAISDPLSLVTSQPERDPDLAAHLMVLCSHGLCWAGAPIARVFSRPEWQDYLHSITQDLLDAARKPLDNPVYLILNLCRVLAARRDGLVLSKRQGGEWALKNLPKTLQEPIRHALSLPPPTSIPTAQIRALVKELNQTEQPQK